MREKEDEKKTVNHKQSLFCLQSSDKEVFFAACEEVATNLATSALLLATSGAALRPSLLSLFVEMKSGQNKFMLEQEANSISPKAEAGAA